MADEHRELRQPDDIDGAHRGMQQQRPGGEQHEDQSHPAVVPTIARWGSRNHSATPTIPPAAAAVMGTVTHTGPPRPPG